MRLQDLHTHSRFDDGAATLEQMVQGAIDRGLSAIGLSTHSPIAGEESWCMAASRLPEYLREACRLRECYRGEIALYCGIEYDHRSRLDLRPFDYVIGSLHSVPYPGGSFDADNTAAIARDGVARHYSGDAEAAAAAYFAQYAALAAEPEVDIVGHFDLITKFDEREPIYRAEAPRYREAAYAAMELLVRAGKIFEVNSGAISRGCRTAPYPAEPLLRHLHSLGGRLCLTSDAHSVPAIACAFDRSLALVRACGFTELWMLGPAGFAPVPICELEY